MHVNNAIGLRNRFKIYVLLRIPAPDYGYRRSQNVVLNICHESLTLILFYKNV